MIPIWDKRKINNRLFFKNEIIQLNKREEKDKI